MCDYRPGKPTIVKYSEISVRKGFTQSTSMLIIKPSSVARKRVDYTSLSLVPAQNLYEITLTLNVIDTQPIGEIKRNEDHR